MDVGNKVIDALELASNRLHEPAVLAAYHHLLALVDAQLGSQIIGDVPLQPLTEPQLVFIAYSLKHVRLSQSMPLVYAAESLIDTLSNSTEAEPEPAADVPDPPAPVEQSAPPPSPNLIHRVRQTIQKIQSVSGGQVTMIGEQHNYGALPRSPLEVNPAADEIYDTGTLAASPTRQQNHDIFISYSHRNGELMRRVRADLRAAGLSVWTDENLQPGSESWKNEVEGAVKTARALVIIMTPDSKQSEWVERELNAAQTYKIPIFPVLANGDTKNAVPFLLNGYQFVDIRKYPDYRDAMQKLVRAIKERLQVD